MPQLYIGLISGTSADAIDAVLLDLEKTPRLIATHSHSLDPRVRDALYALNELPQCSLAQLARLDVELGELFAGAVMTVLDKGGARPEEVSAIGSHGQTVFHQAVDGMRSSMQIADPNIIAERTGITTVADFRRRDMAAGGQGAPLVPAFHKALFQVSDRNRVIVNIGGIANLTILPADETVPVTGFDSGPGNCLMDTWIRKQQGRDMDTDSRWAAGGEINQELLGLCLDDPYFRQVPPKSTGRDYFNLGWLEQRLSRSAPCAAVDVQRTLAELTVTSLAHAIRQHAAEGSEVLVCGGGVHNPLLISGLQQHTGLPVASTASAGIDPDWVEAMTFAWLAQQALQGAPGNLASVTGASHPVVLGGIYPAGVSGS